MSQELLTLAEVAEALGVHYMTAYRYVRTGRLPGRKIGAEWRVQADDLARLTEPPAPGTSRRGDYPRRLEARLLAGDEPGAWRVVEEALTAGVEPDELYLDVLAPALAAIGDSWSRGEVSVADEHQASVLVLRIVGRLGPRFGRRGRPRGTIVMGAPPGDHHGLPVALFADLLRGAGFAVADLGADTPAESFADAARDADRLVAVGICATTPGNERAVRRTVRAVRAVVDAPVVVGGGAVADEAAAASLGADAWGGSTLDALRLFERLAEEAGRARGRSGPAA